MTWVEVQIKTNGEFEEIVTNIMYDLGVKGLAIEDPRDILEFEQTEEDWDYIDPKLFDLEADSIVIKAYFPEGEDLQDKIELVRQNIEVNPIKKYGKSLGQVTTLEVYEKDWAEAWKKYYKPIKIGESIVIKPTWEEYEKAEDEIIIELDPGMAFGTGTHETTILCIKALEKYVREDNLVYDIGTGSGILSIAAAKLGAKKVLAIDLDKVCIKVARENIRLNNVENIIEVKEGNLLDIIDHKADIIVSNIIAEVILEMVDSLGDYLYDEGIFIASGIIEEKIDEVKEGLIQNNFKILEINKMNGWANIISIKE
ncbi:MAG: 50S ribosomal protein L11 methyltransferase [Tissierellia bacterium]|nr:50S ribosomal protein L11 methyltransferase [Tissierellia bacterium]